METEGYVSREQIMADIFETAEREDWSDEKLKLRLKKKLKTSDSSLKQIMRFYREYKDYGRITQVQWREVLNAWRDEKVEMTKPYNAWRCYMAAKEIASTLERYEGISVRWKMDDYDHTVTKVRAYLELEIGDGADLVAIIDEIEEGFVDWFPLSANAKNFLEKLRKAEKDRRSLFD